jgi:hypothetical protein
MSDSVVTATYRPEAERLNAQTLRNVNPSRGSVMKLLAIAGIAAAFCTQFASAEERPGPCSRRIVLE